jgi:hypothetical protein
MDTLGILNDGMREPILDTAEVARRPVTVISANLLAKSGDE